MTTWTLALIIGGLFVVGASVFVWLAMKVGKTKAKESVKDATEDIAKAAEDDVEHIFNDTFREELRNRGRLHFEKIISENAMFLQQDLRLTTSQLNEYMKTEITRTLQEEFQKYEQSITDAKQLAIDSLQKTSDVIDEQRKQISVQVEAEITREKERLLAQFERNMGDIINHYIVAAIGNQIDLSDQLEYILSDLEQNKNAILEDIRHGA